MKNFIKKSCYLLLFMLLILGLTGDVQAKLKEVNLELPGSLNVSVEKVVFSKNGDIFSFLVQEDIKEKKRTQLLYTYDLTNGKMNKIARVSDFPMSLEPLAMSYDGTLLAFRSESNLYVYNTLVGKIIYEFKDVGSMTAASFSYDNRYLAFLQNAEWEVATDLVVLDMGGNDRVKRLVKVVEYENDSKAAGPLVWSPDNMDLYFIEEYTYGTINAKGVLKRYRFDKKTVEKVYDIDQPNTRVANYFYSSYGQKLAIVLRELDQELQKSKYGLLILKQGKFNHGQVLDNWTSAIEMQNHSRVSTGGWIGTNQFYWINRTKSGSTMHIYDTKFDKLLNKKFEQNIFVGPRGIIVKPKYTK